MTRRSLPVVLLGLALWSTRPLPAVATTGPTLALAGDGSYLSVANAPELNPIGAITIEAWIRPTSHAGFPTIVGKRFATAYWLGLTTTGRLRYYTRGSGTSRDGVRAIPLGQWTHVAVTFDGTTRRYFVNGALDFESVTPGSLPVNDSALGIGADGDGAFDFSGNLAEVRIWSIARTQAEIRADLARQIDRDEPGLVAAFNLDGSPEEVLGRMAAVAVGFPSFSGAKAPPEPFYPLRIPRLPSGSAPDGQCLPGEYGPLRLPVWYNTTAEPRWIWVGATSLSLHFCMEKLSRGTAGPASTASVQIDRGASSNTITGTEDSRAGLIESGTFFVQRGVGPPSGGWTSEPSSTFYAGATDPSLEFVWNAEMTVSRLTFPSTPSLEFGLSFVQRDVFVAGDSYGWPQGAVFTNPSTWTSVHIDDSNLPRGDSQNPVGWIRPRVGDRVGSGRQVTFETVAYDDVDVASVEIWVDGAIQRVCDFPGTDDRRVTSCSATLVLPFGMHRAWTVARDHRGRVGSDGAAGFRVEAEGLAPSLALSHTPLVPAVGSPVTLVAQATDPSGIDQITLAMDGPPFTHVCTFPGAPTSATCSLDVTLTAARPWRQYRAEVLDAEDFTARAGPRVAAATGGGLDSDGDGLPNAFEESFCTSHTHADTDEDGLPDDWELRGVQVPGSGFVDLPALGADACRKDVFLQYDYEIGARVEPGVIDDLVAAMRAKGIALHVEQNERPRDPTGLRGAVESAYRRDGSGNYWFKPERNWTHLYAYSRHVVGRSGAWGRYFTFDIYQGGDSCICPLDAVDPDACGRPPDSACGRESRDGQARRFLHELGHTMGLGHGGQSGSPIATRENGYFYYRGIDWDSDNHKPNHISVMNYTYNGGVICGRAPDPGRRTALSLVSKLTFGEANFGVLNEGSLAETPTSFFAATLRAQTCDHAGTGHRALARHSCFDARKAPTGSDSEARMIVLTDGEKPFWRGQALGGAEFPDVSTEPNGVDFDCDGVIEIGSADNVNGDNVDYSLPVEICDGVDNDGDGDVDPGCNWVGGQVLASYEEWSRIPRPPACVVLYVQSPASCYPQPAAYRAGMGAAGTPLDCRVRFVPGEPDRECTGVAGFAAGYTPIEEVDLEFQSLPPGVEFCNATDDDGDLEVDEGCRDSDGDSVADVIDFCPRSPDPSQLDADANGVGEACAEPNRPTNPVVQDGVNGRFVSWQAPGGDVTHIRVYREDLTDGSISYVGETTSNGITDSSAVPGRPVRYRIVPLDPIRSEVLESTATIAVPEPTGLVLLGAAALLAAARARRRQTIGCRDRR